MFKLSFKKVFYFIYVIWKILLITFSYKNQKVYKPTFIYKKYVNHEKATKKTKERINKSLKKL